MAASVEPRRNSPAREGEEEVNNKPQDKKYDATTLVIIGVGALAAAALITIVAVELFHLIRDCWSEYWDKSTLKELKNSVSKKFEGELARLIDLVDKMEATNPKTILRRMSMTHEDEKKFLLYIIENFDVTDEDLKEILKGAHIHLEDEGAAYNKWLNDLQTNPRFSSHPSDSKQYSLKGAFINELLFSKVGNKTWFQLENHPTSLGHVIRHSLDYVRYKIYCANQGPWGQSYYMDHNPRVLKRRLSTPA